MHALNLILYLFHENYIQPATTSSSPNIDKYNDNVNNTKEYKYMPLKECFLCNLRYIGIFTAC